MEASRRVRLKNGDAIRLLDRLFTQTIVLCPPWTRKGGGALDWFSFFMGAAFGAQILSLVQAVFWRNNKR